MTASDKLLVTYRDGDAHVSIGGQRLEISRHDDDDRSAFCPVELVSAALGS